jgi:D-alanine-D-alanine ligase
MKKRIAILTGGASSEREIALASAATVKNVLSDRFDVLYYVLPNDLDKFLSERGSVDAVIPVFHGRGGEDGTIQNWLQTLKIPFLFSGPEAHAKGIDKSLTKTIVAKAGLNTPGSVVIERGNDYRYERPVVIKPLDGGSSIGVSIVKDEKKLGSSLNDAFKQSSKVLIEDFIEGEEYTVPVIENTDGVVALPVIAIRPKTDFFDLKSKYDPAFVDEICPAPIPIDLADALSQAAVKAHQAIGARHVSRSDFIVDKAGKVWFLEINTIPGMTSNSLLPKALKVAGIDFGDLLASWIDSL